MHFDLHTNPFAIPFTIGCIVMFAVLAYKYVRWIYRLPKSDKRLIRKNLFSSKSWRAVCEAFSESLLHRRIFRTNPVLGYMHMSLAFGWFLLIVVGFIETVAYMGWTPIPLRGHVFFKFYSRELEHSALWQSVFTNIMDALLLFVLSGVALAWFKRLYSRMMGMRRTTRHVWGDRVALSALWFIFPLRLIAESTTSAIWHNGGFLTGSLGEFIDKTLSFEAIWHLESVSWFIYALALGVFFCAMPFSRYMHIFTEVPLIFLRKYGIKSDVQPKSFDHFQIEACSRCGICIDPCQLQRDAGIDNVQAVYYLRDRRYNMLTAEVADNCLMCGRCAERCPVGVDILQLRQNSRYTLHNSPSFRRYNYLQGVDTSTGSGRVGYFAGCMTLLSPRIMNAMERIFKATNEEVWWADKNGGVCCGRPIKLTGEVDAAQEMVKHNTELFTKHQITTLVTSCPICLKVFKEDYNLPGIEILHHSEYIDRLIQNGRLKVAQNSGKYTYHDPCELGRGCGIYDEPRRIIESIGVLLEPTETRQQALCCGSSIANTAINDEKQLKIATSLGQTLEATGADSIVTACPLCKKAVKRGSRLAVLDLAEIVADNLK
ncbi:MAG: (Fe-S)-binding protein [Rikenellaceae bacterium]|nr:(Fe-S)-binding protein [Rikenellaceae bacterium]MBR2628563.1 (Fe-S)-binding protein [Alistipes sp.]